MRPSFEQARRQALRLLADAAALLEDGWSPVGVQFTPVRAEARRQALTHIAQARAALDTAAPRREGRSC
jgi:hypothetical protein